MDETMMNATEVENKEVEAIVVGRLGQLGLGNEHGIPGAARNRYRPTSPARS